VDRYLTRHLHSSYKVSEECGVCEVMFEDHIYGNVQQLIECSNRKVGVVRTQPISCNVHILQLLMNHQQSG